MHAGGSIKQNFCTSVKRGGGGYAISGRGSQVGFLLKLMIQVRSGRARGNRARGTRARGDSPLMIQVRSGRGSMQ